jgi:hypothetical protein
MKRPTMIFTIGYSGLAPTRRKRIAEALDADVIDCRFWLAIGIDLPFKSAELLGLASRKIHCGVLCALCDELRHRNRLNIQLIWHRLQ